MKKSFYSAIYFFVIFVTILSWTNIAMATGTAGFFKFGIEVGGEDVSGKIPTLSSDFPVSVGGGVSIAVGLIIVTGNHFETQASIGYLFDAGTKEKLSRYHGAPIELLEFYRVRNHRIGGGITYHVGPNITACRASFSSGPNNVDCSLEEDLDFDAALGTVIQYDYLLRGAMRIELRYTFIDFKSKSIEGKFDGSGVGFALSWPFY